jgi:hypothetical protein
MFEIKLLNLYDTYELCHVPTFCTLSCFCEISGSHGDKYEDNCLTDVEACSLIYTDRRFRGFYCLHHQGDDSWAQHPGRQPS